MGGDKGPGSSVSLLMGRACCRHGWLLDLGCPKVGVSPLVGPGVPGASACPLVSKAGVWANAHPLVDGAGCICGGS